MQSPDSETAKPVVTGNDSQKNPQNGNSQPPSGSGRKPDVPQTPPQSNNAKRGENQSGEWRRNSIERALFFIEVFGLAGLVWYCFLTRGELRVFDSERQTMESEFQIAQSNALVEQNAAKSQLREMQEARKLDERAWMGAVDINEISPQPTDHQIFYVVYKNTGRTPAIDVRCVTGWAKTVDAIPKEEGFPDKSKNAGVAPPDWSGKSYSPPVPADVVGNVKAGIPFFLYGTIWYNDVFGAQHWSQFCYQVIHPPENTNMLEFQPQSFHFSCDDAEGNKPK